MKRVYGYVRVSTVRQGTRGVSLQEQRAAIREYSRRNSLLIVEWYEERETAAKRGRPVFSRMLANLRQGVVTGVIIHKIDRSARNLKDWAELGELLDSGIDVHFAHESLDLHARGGRLSADIQAVIAADYIRNLREETMKGLYGRLKQGLYPLRAPLGYLDMGSGKPKKPDPQRAGLVKEAFELYSTGEYSLDDLARKLTVRGLRNKTGGKISQNGLSRLLNNSFYMGLIHIKRTGETFKGIHKALVSRDLFDAVQDVLSGKRKKGSGKHGFVFRRLFVCPVCGYSLIGEKQKGHIYYRCHSKTCRGNSIREDTIEKCIRDRLKPLQLCRHEIAELDEMMVQFLEKDGDDREEQRKGVKFLLAACESRLDRLTDAYLEGALERPLYLRRKESLLKEIRKFEEELDFEKTNRAKRAKKVMENLELLKSLYSSYSRGSYSERRRLLRILTSNRKIGGKKAVVELNSPFRELADMRKDHQCSPCRAETRRLGKLPERKKRKNFRKSAREVFGVLINKSVTKSA